MLRVLGWMIGVIVSLAGAALLVALASLWLLDWNTLGDKFETLASGALGREVRVAGLDVEPGFTTRIRVAGLEIENTEWGEADALLAIEEGELAIKLLPLLRGDTRFPEILLRRPVLALERDAEGRINWDLGAAAKPDERSEFPIIGRLLMEGGRLRYRDAQRGVDLEGDIATARGDAAGSDPMNMALQGTLEGKPLRFAASGGSIRSLRTRDVPWPVEIDVGYGKTSFKAKGAVLEPLDLKGLNLTVTLEGPTLAQTFPLFRTPLPDTPPYSVNGKLGYKDKVWHLNDFKGTIGDSDVSGSLALDQTQEKPAVEGTLVSRVLDLDDLAGLIGLDPDPEESANPEQKQEKQRRAQQDRLLPDTPVAAPRLKAMNMDIRFEGRKVIAPRLPIEQLQFRIRIVDSRAEANPLEFKIEGGGRVSGEAALNVRDARPSADADLSFEEVDLKPFFKNTRFVQEMGGSFSGHLYILGVGDSLNAMLASARGGGSVVMRGGSISGLMVEAIGLDAAEALSMVVTEDARVGIRCGRLDVDIEQGKASVTRFLLDTTDSLLVAQGSADLGQEMLDVQVEARAKDFSLIDLGAPVRVTGTFTEPDIAIGGIDLFPFLEMGEQKNLDCDDLLGDVAPHAHRDTRNDEP